MIAAAALILAGLLGSAPATEAESPYAVHRWDTHDGLPQNSVNDIAQGEDGVLWLATFGGVVRFDGNRFETFDVSSDPQLDTSRIKSVEADSTGRILVATDSGNVLLRYGPHWRSIELEDCQGGTVTDIVAISDGSDLIVTDRGLFKLPPDTLHAGLIVRGSFSTCAVTPDGRIFLATSNELAELREGQLVPSGPGGLTALFAAPSGELYMSGEGYAARLGPEGLTPLEVDQTAPSVLGIDGAGRPWFSCAGRIGWWDQSQEVWHEVPRATELLDDAETETILSDSTGRVWIGSDRSGLVCISRSPLTGQNLGPIASYASAVASDADGRVYSMGFELQELTPSGPRKRLTESPTRAASSTTGPIWLYGAQGLGRLDGETIKIELPRSLAPPPDGCLLEARDGSLLLSSSKGLFRWNGTELVELDTRGESLLGFQDCLFEREDGSLVLGGSRGILLWNSDEQSTLLSGYELPLGQVRGLAETDDGRLWIGTYGGGVCSLLGNEITLIDRSRGLFENTASALVPLGGDDLLVIGNRSVSRYPLAMLAATSSDRSAEAHGRSFDAGPGLELFEANCVYQPRWAKDAQGRVWMPTLRGVAAFDPAAAPPPEPPPIVRVLPLGNTFQEVRHNPDGSAVFIPRQSRREVQLRFSAASFAQPRQVHFRYRLVGQDPDWSTTSESDRTLTYSQLAPGDYTFEIQAAVADGEYGPVNRYYGISVPYLWYEHTWVRLGAVLLALMFVAGLGLLRLRSVRQRNELLEERVRERTLALENENQERRRVEEDLRKAGEELEDKVTVRTSELAHALANLEWDMRRREKLEGRLRESEKLEAVGRLAGGLAHDFNNILTAILGETDLAQADLETDINMPQLRENLQQNLGNVRDAGMRAARLTRQLLAYSRQQVMQPEVVDPLETLQELQSMLRRLAPDDVAISVVPNSTSAPVLIDPGQLEQVVVNLVVNAAEAMPKGGEIRLSSLVTGDSSTGRSTVIQVADNGLGLAEEDRGRIFEPFFSTKGKARGLGLASVHGIVLQSGGSLDVESEPGEGTTFRVSLPVTTELPTAEAASVSSPSKEGLRVLLVDDEEDVLRISKQMLERSGHSVLGAGDPRAALELAREHAAELDVLVTDVVMPHMNGKQLSDAVLELCPNIKVLFISGYSTEVLSDRDLLQRSANLLAKPFDTRTLAARVSELA